MSHIERLVIRRGFGRSHEREPAPRPSAIDRVLALAAGRLLGLLDCPKWNRRKGRAGGGDVSEAELRELSEHALDERLKLMRRRLPLEDFASAPVALALVAEVAARTLGVRPHLEQLAGAALMLKGRLVEMDTGEGKSLTVALTAAVAAASGMPVEVFTVNDYLASRDAKAFAPFFGRIGLSVGVIDAHVTPAERDAACGSNVLYVVNKDYVFEHLRASAGEKRGPFAGRGLYFAIVDEADSILIDEARTPLIIARESSRMDESVLRAINAFSAALQRDTDYTVNASERRVTLRQGAAERVCELRDAGPGTTLWPERLLREMVEQSLAAREHYRRDRDYIVVDDKVAIVDEYTGRVLADRSWERGLHQFIELGEGLPPTPMRETIARTTFPEFFRRYLLLAGTSGTLRETAPELMGVYGVRVCRVPTHRDCQRRVHGLELHRSSAARWEAVVHAVQLALQRGQAVLVGTRSVAASEEVARRLRALSVDLEVLNARDHAREAEVIAEAGQRGRVTVATNMAGRGTDIRISDEVRAAGGLLVVLTELHESARIDRQLMGRCARQGDPGECVIFASFDDELFRQYLPTLVARLAQSGAAPLAPWAGALMRWLAQTLAEGRHRADRAQILDRNEGLARQLGFAGPSK